MRILLALLLITSSVVADPAPDKAKPAYKAPTPDPTIKTMSYQGTTFAIGNRVRSKEWMGAIPSEESGHPREITLGPDHVGTIIGFFRKPSSYGLELDLAIVRWDAQTWKEWVSVDSIMERGKPYSSAELTELNRRARAMGKQVKLASFVGATNVGAFAIVKR